jgi:fucose 4-O-acetylase-like acetyltransferase
MAKNRLLLIDLTKVLGIVLIVANHSKDIFEYFSLTIPIYNNRIID